MTIRRNWCPTCQEECNNHASICTVCGTALIESPQPSDARQRATRARSAELSEGLQLVSELHQDVRRANDEMTLMLSSLREQMRSIRSMAASATNGDIDSDWQQQLPPEALNPQASQIKGRPTSKEFLEQIPRIKLENTSSLFYQATVDVKISDNRTKYSALLGEFGPEPPHYYQNTKMIVANPRTGKGGISEETKASIERYRSQERSRVILFMERGDGVTFVQKGIMAQAAGASAVIIGNSMEVPWPYIMKDSKKESKSLGLAIPVVMVKKSDSDQITSLLSDGNSYDAECTLEVQKLSDQKEECVVCCDAFHIDETIMRLPTCQHVFHEKCALAWLRKHNTCPFCRRELPTDDIEYENERRRTSRTHATGTDNVNLNGNWEEFYG